MPERPNVQKAKIASVDNPGKAVTCHFNPDTFSMERTINWKADTNIGNDASNLTFGGGQASDLTMTLLFDTTDTGKDVRDTYKTLIELSNVDTSKKNSKTGKSEPPVCRFEWGKFLTFKAVITKLSQKFTMFKADGTPVRAEVTVTFKQVGEATRGQNPTSRPEPRKIWVVSEGQTLAWIAYQEYGDSGYWRHIAETNDLADPLDLRPGQVLKLVPLP
jgi:hypothetical protein